MRTSEAYYGVLHYLLNFRQRFMLPSMSCMYVFVLSYKNTPRYGCWSVNTIIYIPMHRIEEYQ